MNPNVILFFVLLTITQTNHRPVRSEPPLAPAAAAAHDAAAAAHDAAAAAHEMATDNETIYERSKQLCWHCIGESIQFLYGHNLVRARKMELPLVWDSQLANYASWWAGQRQADCQLVHSFPEDDFKLGENIYWGGGSTWTALDAVGAWADEEKYYDYNSNSCAEGQMCGHYTQIVWKTTRSIGCARVVCDSGDVFMTCNYYPPGNYVGERPY